MLYAYGHFVQQRTCIRQREREREKERERGRERERERKKLSERKAGRPIERVTCQEDQLNLQMKLLIFKQFDINDYFFSFCSSYHKNSEYRTIYHDY